jgi:hypothetical protein
MIAFLLANFKWLVPLLLFLGLGIDDGIKRVQLANLRAEQAKEVAEAQALVDKKLAENQALSDKLVADYTAQITVLQGSLNDALVKQATAQRTPLCDHSPAATAFDNALRSRDQAGAGRAPAAR